MLFSTYFRFTSYATFAAAVLALLVAGGVSVWLAAAFALVMLAAWKLEGTRWQLTERVALVVILVSIPVFYFDWRVLTPLILNVGDEFPRSRGIGATASSIAHGNV